MSVWCIVYAMSNILENIADYRKIDLEGLSYQGINLISQINLALYHFYAPQPDLESWSPIILHKHAGAFDPGSCSKNMGEYIRTIEGRPPSAIYSGEHLFFNNNLITREFISKNEIIIGFYDLNVNTFRRYLIQDIDNVCKLLQIDNNDLLRLDNITDKKAFQSRLLSFIETADHIQVDDKYILQVTNHFLENTDNMYILKESILWKAANA